MFWFNRKKKKHKAVVSLGGGFNQLPLINAAQQLGYKVVCVDQDTFAPGMLVAEIKIQESILNYEDIYTKLNELFLDDKISAVLSRSYGEAILSVAYLCERYSLKFIPFSRIDDFIDKKKMKAAFAKIGIPSPKHALLHKVKKLPFDFPFIVKPVSGHAKNGVRLIENEKDLNAYTKQNPAESGETIAERYIEGDEIVALGLVHKKKFHLVEISDKIRSESPYFIDLMHVTPSKFLHRWQEIETIGQTIADQYEIINSPLVMEIIFTDKEELFVIEAVSEFGGELLADYLIPTSSGYNIFKNAVAAITGKDFTAPDQRRRKNACAVKYITGKNGVIAGLNNSPHIEEHNGVFYKFFKTIGDEVKTPKTNHDRIAVVVAKGRNREEAIENAEKCEKNLSIIIESKIK